MKHPANNNPPDMNELPDALNALVQTEGYKDLSDYLRFRTSRKLPFVSDSWGGQDITHFELHHLGKTLQITCYPDRIELSGFVKVTQTCLNLHVITPA